MLVNSKTANQMSLPPDVNSCVHPEAVEAMAGDRSGVDGRQGGDREGGGTVSGVEEGEASDVMQVEESEPFIVLPNPPSCSSSSLTGMELGRRSYLHMQRKSTPVPVETAPAVEASTAPTLPANVKVNTLHNATSIRTVREIIVLPTMGEMERFLCNRHSWLYQQD